MFLLAIDSLKYAIGLGDNSESVFQYGISIILVVVLWPDAQPL